MELFLPVRLRKKFQYLLRNKVLTSKRTFTIIVVNNRLPKQTIVNIGEIKMRGNERRMNDTKEKILLAALELFAGDGYEAVSVSRIAGALGMTKGALYKHYKNKRDIFDSIVARMEQSDAERAGEYEVPEGTLDEMTEEYENTSIEQMIEFSKAQFRYWTEERFSSCFRKMLTLEQYRNEEMKELYQQYLVSGPLGYVTDLFTAMGIRDAQELAAEFYGPMYMLYSYYDGAEDPTGTEAILEKHFEKMRKLLENGEKNRE